jgi:hypothetical protein
MGVNLYATSDDIERGALPPGGNNIFCLYQIVQYTYAYQDVLVAVCFEDRGYSQC